ncbi:MAG: bifunctional diaminohydroxyphosphoribosylaminopyrimidine deaminase/5-amino-6-(5-phosphoribosylamino)uracil reductase, partial [Tolypothrix sp. T3-bin4]|nr:bifunctional diaminohydroxyphosphoribosylaminopyrimidine deaminase/5-amino-6-(5-phosphoribosylamino)uracil reductase [Tolypothrix sp. T3-bin4]
MENSFLDAQPNSPNVSLSSDRSTPFDHTMMQRCIELARHALGRTSPNPLVGAVIVQNGEIVGEGFHPGAGQP